ncbi:MAG: hypothetical protein V4674_03080 [Patescibacteria group bacterium]
MSFFSFKKKEPELHLLFDFDSGSIGVGLFRKEGDALSMIFAARYPLPHSYLRPKTRFFAEVKKVFVHALLEAKKHGAVHASTVLCILGSPLSVSHVRRAEAHFSDRALVSEQTQKDMIEGAVLSFKKEVAESFDVDEEVPKFTLLDEEHLAYRANGYSIETLVGQKAQMIALDLLLSVTPAAFNTMLEETVRAEFPRAVLSSKARAFALFQTLSSSTALGDLVIVDVAAHDVELVVVREGRISEIGTFPFGKEVVLRLLGKELGCEKEVVSSTLLATHAGAVSTEERMRCALALGKTREELVAKFHELLGEISELYLVPKQFLLFAPPELRDFYTSFFQDPSFRQFNIENTAFETVLPSTIYPHPFFGVEPSVKPDDLLTWEAGAVVHSLFG